MGGWNKIIFTIYLIDNIKKSFSIFPGLFVSLVLPINTPISVLIFGCVIAVIFGKMLYGGFGQNIFNPALIGCLFALTCYGAVINSNGGYVNKYELDTIGSATPLTNYHMLNDIGSYDTLVKPYGSLKEFFLGMIPGTVGETCSLLIILSYIYLVIKKVIKWKIPIIYVSTVFVLTYIIGCINGVGIWYPLFNILSGGLLFGAVFMATDPVTSPTTCLGQIIYAIALGILTVVFRNLTGAPEGVLTSILTMNMFVMLLDRIGSAQNKKTFISLTIMIFLIIGVGLLIGNKYKYKNDVDNKFKVYEKTADYYIVSQVGNEGPIKTKVYILESNETESYYKLVENANYVNTLIENQNNLDNVDTISGATISSSALKKMIINVKKDMEK